MTSRQKQLVVTPDLSVRVTQTQQTLSVDIMFVYRMPILLGLLTPLVLVQVYDLKDDRGTDSVGAGLKKLLSVARGCARLRRSGSGVISTTFHS
jgi:hypothetical protein